MPSLSLVEHEQTGLAEQRQRGGESRAGNRNRERDEKQAKP